MLWGKSMWVKDLKRLLTFIFQKNAFLHSRSHYAVGNNIMELTSNEFEHINNDEHF